MGHTNRSNAYFPLDYLPQAIGLKIAMLVNLPPYAQWQAARISNSILYAIMGCFAIALLPRWKSLMALLLVIPPVAFVASSLMIDGMIVTLSACMVAAIAAAAEGKRLISLPHTAVLGVLAWALACEKLPYAFVAVAVLFLPSAVMTVRRKLEFVGIAAVLTGALYLPWSVLFGSSLAQVDVSHNVSVALSHPILTIGKNSAFHAVPRDFCLSADLVCRNGGCFGVGLVGSSGLYGEAALDGSGDTGLMGRKTSIPGLRSRNSGC